MPIYAGTNGLMFYATVKYRNGQPVNLAEAEEMVFRFRKPRQREVLERPAVLRAGSNGHDGRMQYQSTAEDLDRAGVYRVQAWVRMNDGRVWPTNERTFPVMR